MTEDTCPAVQSLSPRQWFYPHSLTDVNLSISCEGSDPWYYNVICILSHYIFFTGSQRKRGHSVSSKRSRGVVFALLTSKRGWGVGDLCGDPRSKWAESKLLYFKPFGICVLCLQCLGCYKGERVKVFYGGGKDFMSGILWEGIRRLRGFTYCCGPIRPTIPLRIHIPPPFATSWHYHGWVSWPG